MNSCEVGSLDMSGNQVIEPRRKTGVATQPREFAGGDHTTPTSFSQGLLDNIAGGGFRGRHIGDAAERASQSESAPEFDVLFVEIGAMKHQHVRGLGSAPKSVRDGHVEFGWIHIRELMDAKRGLV